MNDAKLVLLVLHALNNTHNMESVQYFSKYHKSVFLRLPVVFLRREAVQPHLYWEAIHTLGLPVFFIILIL